MLHRQSKFVAAHAQADRLIAEDSADNGHRALKASVLVRTGGYTEAIALYREVLARHPGQPRLWINLGHVLKTVGDRPGSVAAYRAAIAGCATLGDAWWSLANLKTERLDADEIAAMGAALARATAPTDRYHLHFALGKALEDAREWEASFAHYAEGNRLRRAELPYDPERTTEHMRRSRELLTREAFATRNSGGDPSPEPIFIVGLQRAGSTLIEQILASHSEVEGTMELPDIGTIAGDLGGRRERRKRGRGLSAPPARAFARRARRARSPVPRRHARPAQDRTASFHRQDAQQLRAYRADPPYPAERGDHRCATSPDRDGLLGVQAALLARAGLYLRSGRARPLLARLRRADGALRRGAAGSRAPCVPRASRRRSRGGNPGATGALRPCIRARLPRAARDRSSPPRYSASSG